LEFIQVQIDKIKSNTNNDDNNIEPVVIVDNISGDLNV
ncbi:terminase, partial [Bacillus thuringiensis]